MLGLLLLYWIGKYFYKLAEEYNKSKWGFAILGIVVYYAGIIIFSFLTGIVGELISPGFVDTINEILFTILMLPFGIISCYTFYKILENTWKKITPNELVDEI